MRCVSHLIPKTMIVLSKNAEIEEDEVVKRIYNPFGISYSIRNYGKIETPLSNSKDGKMEILNGGSIEADIINHNNMQVINGTRYDIEDKIKSYAFNGCISKILNKGEIYISNQYGNIGTIENKKAAKMEIRNEATVNQIISEGDISDITNVYGSIGKIINNGNIEYISNGDFKYDRPGKIKQIENNGEIRGISSDDTIEGILNSGSIGHLEITGGSFSYNGLNETGGLINEGVIEHLELLSPLSRMVLKKGSKINKCSLFRDYNKHSIPSITIEEGAEIPDNLRKYLENTDNIKMVAPKKT